MFKIDQIQAMRVFLNRVQLSGNEVPAFNNVMNAVLMEEQSLVEEARRMQAAANRKPELKAVQSEADGKPATEHQASG